MRTPRTCAALSQVTSTILTSPSYFLSLGCQNAQIDIFKEQLYARNPRFNKPLLIFEQQQKRDGTAISIGWIRDTFLGFVEANKFQRTPAPRRACVWA